MAVDLDGTLTKTDTTWESVLKLLKERPDRLPAAIGWLRRGKAYFKRQLAKYVAVDASWLPYHEPFVAWLKEQQAAGRQLILITASDQSIAEAVAGHLGIFSEARGSDGVTNMSGKEKRKWLVQKFGERGYAYAGDRAVDLPVWAGAGEIIVVNGSARLIEGVKAMNSSRGFPLPLSLFKEREAPRCWRGGEVWRALRVHQWVKNILIFVSIVLAHQVHNIPLLINSAIAFASFCLAASSIYLTNDLCDLESDRRHPVKKYRPLAAGTIPVTRGMAAAPLLLAGSALLASRLPTAFWLVLAAYLILTTSYSWYFKRIPLLDVLLLAGLYVIRIFAGQAATGIFTSSWLLAFAMFFFLSLALTKRYSDPAVAGRGYVAADYPLLAFMGVASGFLSILVGALYINSHDVTRLYQRPQLLWFILPLLLYWISRLWLLAHRGWIKEDPLVFALKDRISYIIGLGAAVILLLAI